MENRSLKGYAYDSLKLPEPKLLKGMNTEEALLFFKSKINQNI